MSSPHCTFSTGEPALSDLLVQIGKGEVQLPDFQRGWVWDDNHIRSLIASVSVSYPIGAVMLLEVGGNGVRFKHRPLEGSAVPNGTLPAKLILDGQQRLTSLFLTMKSGQPVSTKTDKDEPIQRLYFLDIDKCVQNGDDRMDAVRSLPPFDNEKFYVRAIHPRLLLQITPFVLRRIPRSSSALGQIQ